VQQQTIANATIPDQDKAASAATMQEDEDENAAIGQDEEQQLASALAASLYVPPSSKRQDEQDAATAMASLVQNPTIFHVSDGREDVKASPSGDNPEEKQHPVKQRSRATSRRRKLPIPKQVKTVPKKPRMSPPNPKDNAKEDSNNLPTGISNGDPVRVLCGAGESCHNPGRQQMVTVIGNGFNGEECCSCRQACHFVCLFKFQDDMYCKNCYKENVVAKCNTETLFDDLFGNDDLTRGAIPSEPTHKDSQLLQFVNNFLKSHKMMNIHQLKKWRKERHELTANKLVNDNS
jgi:hypothetical protein